MNIQVIDLANYSVVPSQSQLNFLKGFGLQRMIVGSSYGQVALAQLQAGIAAGLQVESYVWVKFDDTWQTIIDRGIAPLAGRPIHRVWLDLEDDPNESAEVVISRIREVVAHVHAIAPSLEVGLYTRAGWWNANAASAAGDAEYALPLFYAHYDGDPTCKWDTEAFGRWTRDKVIYKQYHDSTDEDGVNVDLDSICEETMTDTYTKAEVDAKIGSLLGLGIAQGQQIAAIAGAFANHVQNHADTAVGASAADWQKIVDDIKAQQADLSARIEKAAEILGTPVSPGS